MPAEAYPAVMPLAFSILKQRLSATSTFFGKSPMSPLKTYRTFREIPPCFWMTELKRLPRIVSRPAASALAGQPGTSDRPRPRCVSETPVAAAQRRYNICIYNGLQALATVKPAGMMLPRNILQTEAGSAAKIPLIGAERKYCF
jgi:hypothetical protein